MKNTADLPLFSTPKPRIFGHRGASGEAPENTLISFEKAFADGADAVEFDVRLSKDGEVVILHDPTVRRTTDGHGRVAERALKEIKRLDAGYRFTANLGSTYPFRGRKIEVPTLAEFFLTFPQARAIIEIKPREDGVASKVIETVRRHGKEGQVILATEHDRVMSEVRATLREQRLAIATGFSYGEVAEFMRWIVEKSGELSCAGQALTLPCQHRGTVLVTPQTVEAARELGVEMWVWTINETGEMIRLLQLGVDGLITDYPGRLRNLART